MAGRFSIEAVFKAVDKITAPVSRMQNRVKKMTRNMRIGFRKLNRTVNKVSAGIKKGVMTSVLALGLMSAAIDRKSTRLNSSHTVISYAVFCLKKKK